MRVSKSSAPVTPPPVPGRSHIEIQTDQYIENLSILCEAEGSTVRSNCKSSSSSTNKDIQIQKKSSSEEIEKVGHSDEKANTIIDHDIEHNHYSETQSFAQQLLANIRRDTIDSMEKAGYFD